MTGVSVRTIRYYIAEGLLPSPGARGRKVSYGEEHLLRLRLVRCLVERRVPLDEIRERLAGLSRHELQVLVEEEEARRRRREDAKQEGRPRDYLAMLMNHDDTDLLSASERRSALYKYERRLPPRPEPESALEPMSMYCPAMRRSSEESEEPPVRWNLAQGITLSVERPIYERYRQLTDLLVRVARAILSEMRR